MSVDGCIHEIGYRQDGVFTTAQAGAVGASRGHLARRVDAGVYCRMLRGGFRIAAVPPTWERLVRVTCLVVNEAAAAARTAAALWGLDPFTEGPLDLVVPRGRRTTLVRARQTLLRPCDLRQVRGIPVTSVELTLCDLAPVVPLTKLEVGIDSAIRLGLTTSELLWAAAEEVFVRGRKGGDKMRAALDALVPGGPGLGPAAEYFRLLEAAGVPLPVREYPVRLPDGRTVYLDGADEDERVWIEIDDYRSHTGPRALDNDHERQIEVQEVLRGWDLLRFTTRHIRRRRQWVVDKTAIALGLDPADHQLPAGFRP